MMTRGLLLIVAAALVLVGCGGGNATESSSGETAETAPAPAPAERAGSAIAGTTLDGETISLADFRGRPVFVNVWSSW